MAREYRNARSVPESRGQIVQNHRRPARFLERQHRVAADATGAAGDSYGMSTSHGFLRSLNRSDREAEHLYPVRLHE